MAEFTTGSMTGVTGLYTSGTYVQHSQNLTFTLLCALSGLAIIPVRCDSTGRIGSIA
jgi:hypothetical protein